MNRHKYIDSYSKPSVRWIECGDIWTLKDGPRKIPRHIQTKHKWWPKKIRIVTNRGIASQDIPSRDFYEVHAFYSTETVRIEEKLMLFPETIYQFYE